MKEAITSNRRRIDPHLLFVFIVTCIRIQGIRLREVVVSYLFCQAQLAPTVIKEKRNKADRREGSIRACGSFVPDR